MRLEYDPEVDTLYLLLGGDPEQTVRSMQQANVTLDYDAQGHLSGVEILQASKHLEPDTLRGLRPPNPELTLAEAASESGLSAGTLRVLLNSGRLSGHKRGRDWVVSATDLMNYLESRAPQGRPPKRLKARRARVPSARKGTADR